MNAALKDPAFLNSLLDSLPGVDKNEIDVDVCSYLLIYCDEGVDGFD